MIFDEGKVTALILKWQCYPEMRDLNLVLIIDESQKLMDMLIGRILKPNDQDFEDWQSDLKLKLITILPKYDPKHKAFSFLFRAFTNHLLSQISRDGRRVHVSDIEDEDLELAESKLRKLEHEFEQNSYTWN